MTGKAINLSEKRTQQHGRRYAGRLREPPITMRVQPRKPRLVPPATHASLANHLLALPEPFNADFETERDTTPLAFCRD